MANNRNLIIQIKLLLAFLIVCLSYTVSAQKKDSTIARINSFGGAVTIQSKGISTIPNLTLGKPAAVFDMKLGRKLTFEPQFRFALTGKPWAMVFWWRYNHAIDGKLRMILSTNYSFSYKTITVESSGDPQEIIRTTRYLVGAIEPIYQLSKHIDIGMYLFFNYGIEKFISRNTWMVSFRPGFSNILFTKNITARINPEIYYLKMDNNDGVYLNARFSISKKNFPLSVSGLINKPVNSNIISEYDFLWNVGLSYTFNKQYMEVR
ncbi:MAG TPA: hypothetical protein DEO60_15925 [Bacteroidales bacterium]|nr:hypothetical protein [Bacteroidales bacterium]HBZ22622.1 hypothetical protein [Bacteroidales bacterium]